MCVRVPPSELSGYCLRQAVADAIGLLTYANHCHDRCHSKCQGWDGATLRVSRRRADTLRYIPRLAEVARGSVGHEPKAPPTQGATVPPVASYVPKRGALHFGERSGEHRGERNEQFRCGCECRPWAPLRRPPYGVRRTLIATAARSSCFVNASHAARCVARHGVASHAEPPTIECACPATKKVARHCSASYSVSWRSHPCRAIPRTTSPIPRQLSSQRCSSRNPRGRGWFGGGAATR